MNPLNDRRVTPEEIDRLIYQAIRKVKPSLETVPLTPETRIASLGMKSLERLTMVFEIEEAFEISIVDANRDTFTTIAEAREIILKLLAAASRAPA